MSTGISRKTVDVTFTKANDGRLKGVVDGSLTESHPEEARVLRLHYSLMGELSPIVSPLSVDFSLGEKTIVYRYDWVVGITSRNPCYKWNWWGEIGLKRAIVVQLLIDPGESKRAVSELAAFLLALSPSQDTSSWFDRNLGNLGESLVKIAGAAEPFAKTASGILKATAAMSNFVASDGKGRNGWFIYRFVDEVRRCCAVEWNISRDVVHRCGPMLRGSILLAFHGDEASQGPMTLLLRPRLNFVDDHLDLQPPYEGLEKGDKVALSIHPVAAPAPT